MARIQEEMTKKGRFLRPSELNGRSLSVIDQFQDLMGTAIRSWKTFNFCFRIIALINYSSFLFTFFTNSRYILFFYLSLNTYLARWNRSTTTKA